MAEDLTGGLLGPSSLAETSDPVRERDPEDNLIDPFDEAPDRDPVTSQQRMRETIRTATPPVDVPTVGHARSDTFESANPGPLDGDLTGGLLGQPRTAADDLGKAIGTIAKSAAGGAVQGSGIIPATATGASIGARVAPGTKAGPILGGLFGFGVAAFAGFSAAEELERMGLVIADPMKLPQKQQALGVTGQALGAGLSMAPSPFIVGSARMANSMTGRLVNDIINNAQHNPIGFLAAETTSTISAAVTAGAFEVYFPRQPEIRSVPEAAAGMLNPTRWLISGATRTVNAMRSFVNRLSEKGRMDAAGRQLVAFLRHADPDLPPAEQAEAILANIRALRLEKESLEGVDPRIGTVGQLTGDVRISQAEAELAQLDQKFYGDRANFAEDIQKDIAFAINTLKATGDPNAVRLAAEVRAFRYHTLVQRVLAGARLEATEAAEKVLRETTTGLDGTEVNAYTRSDISKKVEEIYTRALDRAGKIEEDLWKAAFPDPTAIADTRAARGMLGNLKGRLGLGEELPAEITNAVEAMARAEQVLRLVDKGARKLPGGIEITAPMIKDAQKTLSIEKIQNTRSFFLRLLRGQERSTSPLSDTARGQYGAMAAALLEDMTNTGAATKLTEHGRRGAGGRFSLETPFDLAREFTRQKANSIEATFMGAAHQQTSTGLRIPPEAILHRMFASGDEMTAVRMQELFEIANTKEIQRFMTPEQVTEMTQDATQMYDLNARFLRTFIDGSTVTVEEATDSGQLIARQFKQLDLKKAKKFLEDHEDTLNLVPTLRDDLRAAVQSEEHFANFANKAAGLRKTIDQTSAAAQVLKVESVADAIRGALTAKKPVESLTKLITEAKIGGEDATQGIRVAIWDDLLRSSGGEGSVNPAQFLDNFNSPIKPGLPSLREIMIEHNLIPPEQVANVDKMMTIMGNLGLSSAVRAKGEAILDNFHVLESLVVRVAGAEAGRQALRRFQQLTGGGGGTTGPTLIVSQRAAQAAADLAQRGPQLGMRQLMIDALSGAPLRPGDPPYSLFEALLRPAQDAKTVTRDLQRIHSYAWTAGLLGSQDLYREGTAYDQSTEARVRASGPQVPLHGRAQFREVEQPSLTSLFTIDQGQGTADVDLDAAPLGGPAPPPLEPGVQTDFSTGPLNDPAQGEATAALDADTAPVEDLSGGLLGTAPQGVLEPDPEADLAPVEGEPDVDPEADLAPVEEEGEEEEEVSQSSGLVDQLKQFENSVREGFDEQTQTWKPHTSVEGGRPTIAYGHKLTDEEIQAGVINVGGQPISIDQGLTEEQATALLEQDIAAAEAGARRVLPFFDQLPPQAQQIAIQMAFQMGPSGLAGFEDMSAALQQTPPDFNAAADAMLDSKWAREDSPKRAKALADLMRTLGAPE